MIRYYIVDAATDDGFAELTEEDFLAIMGDETVRPYASKVYRGLMSIEEVPEDLQEAVQAVVDAKIARWGEYDENNANADDFESMFGELMS